jgi:transposase
METQFQPYEQHQRMLFPPSLDELIDDKALVRVVNSVLDQIEMAVLEAPFEGGGRPAFHPRMMLKVLVYAYCCKVYSCRQIAKALTTDIHFMWLSGWQRPDFRTINRFRSDYFKDVLPHVFSNVAQFLVAEGYIRSTDYFLDGTKMAADANKHSYVWRKNVERFKARVQARALEILKEAEALNAGENRELGDKDLPERGTEAEIGSAQIQQVAAELNRTLQASQQPDKALEKCARKLKQEAEKLAKYEEQQELLDGRNSYSKTDPDATFMRMKDGELRAGYNVQIGTQDGFITGCSVHQNANDGATLVEHLDQREQLPAPEIKSIMTDSGYGSEEVYTDVERRELDGYVQYKEFHRDDKDAQPKFHWTRFAQDEKQNTFTCPAGRKLLFKERSAGKSVSGFAFETEIYECESCAGCPFRSECVKGPENRRIHYNRRLHAYRKAAFQKLTSERGVELRKQRGNACESPFGDLKHNQGVRRFRLRGLVKVGLEMLLHSISQNLRKVFGRQIAARTV